MLLMLQQQSAKGRLRAAPRAAARLRREVSRRGVREARGALALCFRLHGEVLQLLLLPLLLHLLRVLRVRLRLR